MSVAQQFNDPDLSTGKRLSIIEAYLKDLLTMSDAAFTRAMQNAEGAYPNDAGRTEPEIVIAALLASIQEGCKLLRRRMGIPPENTYGVARVHDFKLVDPQPDPLA
jgi:hypothetical protein